MNAPRCARLVRRVPTSRAVRMLLVPLVAGAAMLTPDPAAAAVPNTLGSMRAYFGSTHNHTGAENNHSNDGSTAADVIRNAKSHGFDWIFLTEHSGSTGPESTKLTQFHTAPMSAKLFYDGVKAVAMAQDDSEFVAVPGFEYSDNDGGTTNGVRYSGSHMTGADTSDFVSADGLTKTPVTFMDYLVAQRAAGLPAFGGFNHPGGKGHPGSLPGNLTAARRNVIVSTEVAAGYGYNSTKEAANYQAYVIELDRGWRVGPVCGLDGHGGYLLGAGAYNPGTCRTGAVMPYLSKANLEDAFMDRRVYSARDTNMQVKMQANGEWMGSEIGTPGSVSFAISVNDPDVNKPGDRIVKMELVTDHGQVVASHAVNGYSNTWTPTVPSDGHHYFFVRVFSQKHANMSPASFTAVTAPVWLR